MEDGSTRARGTAAFAWIVPHTPEFKLLNPMGVTCDDVFVCVEISGRSTIARVRIDSLGPGLPPH